MQLDYLYTNEMLAQVYPQLEKMMERIAKGVVPHCENILLELMRKLASLMSGDGQATVPAAIVLW